MSRLREILIRLLFPSLIREINEELDHLQLQIDNLIETHRAFLNHQVQFEETLERIVIPYLKEKYG